MRSVPVADPAPPRSLDHVTWTTPTSSLAVPPIATAVLETECVALLVGVVIVTTGALPSAIEKSIAPLQGPAPAVFDARTDQEAGPAASATPGLWRHTVPAVAQPACVGVRSTWTRGLVLLLSSTHSR